MPATGVGRPLLRTDFAMRTRMLRNSVRVFALCQCLGTIPARLPAQAPAPDPAADVAALAAHLNGFAQDLNARIAPADANLTSSGASVAFVLLMALAGAEAETAKELLALLAPPGFDAPRVHAAAGRLLAAQRQAVARGGFEIALVNDLWPQAGHPILPAYVAVTRDRYGAELRPMDYAGGAEQAREAINAYIAKATKDRIRDLIPPGLVTTDTRLVLTNAVYFKALWQHPFDVDDTRDSAFALPGGERIRTPFMHLTHDFDLAEAKDMLVLRLPYEGGRHALDLVLPQGNGSLAAAEQALRGEADAAWQRSLRRRPVIVGLPRFRIEGAFRLVETLRALGLVTATTAGRADFDGIDGGKAQLFIDEVVHKTFLEVGEKGTEAAAATAAVMKAGAAMPHETKPPIRFVADRPFAFGIRDLASGLLLFSGRVNDPRGRT
jgi:serpin B